MLRCTAALQGLPQLVFVVFVFVCICVVHCVLVVTRPSCQWLVYINSTLSQEQMY